MRLHDITPDVPEWVQAVARAWYRTYQLRHMPMVYRPADDTLSYVWGGNGRMRPGAEYDMGFQDESFWYDWRFNHWKTSTFDPAWVVIV